MSPLASFRRAQSGDGSLQNLTACALRKEPFMANNRPPLAKSSPNYKGEGPEALLWTIERLLKDSEVQRGVQESPRRSELAGARSKDRLCF